MATHLRLMAEAFITIARRGVVDDPSTAATCRAPVDTIARSFVSVVDLVEQRRLRGEFMRFIACSAPLCSFRCSRSKEAKVLGYHKALRALRRIVQKAGGDPNMVGLHSLRIGAATTLAAGGQIPDRIFQRKGRWKEGSRTFKLYTRNSLEDIEILSRKLARGRVL
ncbi:unnamed protein product [Pylaiella littoralis]